MRALTQAVLVGGVVLPTGTEWSKELGEKVPDRLWSGDPEPPKSPEGKPAQRRSSRSKSE